MLLTLALFVLPLAVALALWVASLSR